MSASVTDMDTFFENMMCDSLPVLWYRRRDTSEPCQHCKATVGAACVNTFDRRKPYPFGHPVERTERYSGPLYRSPADLRNDALLRDDPYFAALEKHYGAEPVRGAVELVDE